MSSERRQYPRIVTDASIQIIDESGRALPAVAVDISLLGVQLLCDALTARQVTAQLAAGHDKVHVRVPIEAEEDVEAYCRVIYFRHLPKDECRLGLQYQQFVGASYDCLEGFIDQNLSYPEEALLSATSH